MQQIECFFSFLIFHFFRNRPREKVWTGGLGAKKQQISGLIVKY